MPRYLQVKRHAPSGTIILQRPERRNALHREALAELAEALGDLHLEKSVKAVILTGSGSAFSAGLDLEELQAAAGQEDALGEYLSDVEAYRELLEQMLRYPKPLIAAVNGPALGAGAALALACDLLLAAPDAVLGFPEPRRGLVSGLAAPLLTFRAGGAVAARLLLTGEPLDAAEAQRLGLVLETAPFDLLWAKAHDLAQRVAQCAPPSLLMTKRLLNEQVGEHLFTLLSAGAAMSATARTTEAAAEGVAAFLEKRPPKWG